MSFTIGSALTDARDRRFLADLLVEGQWLHGLVTAADGFGVVLEREDGSHSVIRMESISAVEVDASGRGSNRRTAPKQIAMAH